MAKPRRAVPRGATNREPERPQEGTEALRAVLAEYGGEYADAIEYTDELENVLTTTILVLASADDDEVKYVTDRIVALVEAGEALGTDGTVELAEVAGENADDLAAALDIVLSLQRDDQLEDLIGLARAASGLDIDDDTVRALNRLLGLVGSVDRTVTSLTELGRRSVTVLRSGARYLTGA